MMQSSSEVSSLRHSLTNMVGRKVRAIWNGDGDGVVVKWEPLGSGMCDTLVRFHTGRECWFASSDLRPEGTDVPLPSRQEAQKEARARAAVQLRAIRARHVANFYQPWPGAEHGKVLVGRAIDGALEALES